MLVSVRRVGNSLGVLLPREAAERVGIGPGSRLFLRTRKGEILLTERVEDPVVSALRRSLKPLLGKKVLSLYLYGSYLSPRYREGKSDVDLFLLLRDLREETLRAVVRRLESAEETLAEQGREVRLSPLWATLGELPKIAILPEILRGVPLYAPLESGSGER